MDLSRFLKPKTIAVFGGVEAAEVIRQSGKMGFDGEIWPVHPKKEEVGGLKCFKSLSDLPAAPDAAYIAVNRNLTIELVRELAEMGCGGAVCYATGFTEAGEEGAALARELVEASGDMMILGPNCYGVLNYLDGVMLWPDQQGGKRVENGVAIVTQSSNVAFNLTLQNKALPIAYMQSLGVRLKYDLPEAIRCFADDDNVTAIGLHIEGIANPQAFEEAVLYARERGKPIVAIKIGRSEAAQKIAMSHTASLTGADALMDALFARLAIARVKSLDVFIETLKILHVAGPVGGMRCSALSTSGGDCSLIVDAADELALDFPEMSPEAVAGLKDYVHPSIDVANPLDYQLFDWRDEERLYQQFKKFMEVGYDFNISLLDFPRLDRCSDADWQFSKNGFIRAAAELGGHCAILSAMPENMTEAVAEELIEKGIVPLAGIDNGLAAIEAAAKIGMAWKEEAKDPLLSPPATPVCAEQAVSLNEAESKAALSAYGVQVPSHKVVKTADEAVAAASAIGYPVIAKVLGVDHKTDIGGVKLNLKDEAAVRRAIDEMTGLADAFLIEAMVADMVAEIIVGVNSDAQFGPCLVVGAGGVMVELLKDSASLLLPTTKDEILNALNGLKTAPLFHGFRGRPKADLEAAADAVLAISNYVIDNKDKVYELDVNPLMLLPEGKGAVAVDALVRLAK